MVDDGLGETGRLRAEITALRARVQELETALAERSNGPAGEEVAPRSRGCSRRSQRRSAGAPMAR